MTRHVRLTIAEPFPVDARTPAGPFYAAGSSWWTPYDAPNLAFVEWQAAHIRADGYTVTVEVVER